MPPGVRNEKEKKVRGGDIKEEEKMSQIYKMGKGESERERREQV